MKSDYTLLNVLTHEAPKKIFLATLLGLLSGLLYSLLIPLTLSAISPPSNPYLNPYNEEQIVDVHVFWGLEISTLKFAVFYMAVCLCIMLTKAASQIIINCVVIDAMVSIRKSTYLRISQLPIQSLESIGSARLVTTLVSDIPKIINGSRLMQVVGISAVTVMGLLGFIFYLNEAVFIFCICALLFGIATFQLPLIVGLKQMSKARDVFNGLQEAVNGLINGAKELKLNNIKRKDFFHHELFKRESAITKHSKRGRSIMLGAGAYGDLIVFLNLGIVIFIFRNHFVIEDDTMLATIMALLYITTPMIRIMDNITPLQESKVSLNHLNQLIDEMPIENMKESTASAPQWEQISIDNVFYQYRNKHSNESFSLGPICLTFQKGQVTFIVGGNGSGKSTLGKLISLHYLPSSGDVKFDNEAIVDSNRNLYRQGISAIYSDFYLFSRLIGFDEQAFKAEIQNYLTGLDLEHKVEIVDGQFSTTSLSDGQRKRLALLVAFMEDRDLYLFDEWAADQDPLFKKVFYTEILPELKAKGKTIIAITHDDRYFHLADRVITMENGNVLKQSTYPPS